MKWPVVFFICLAFSIFLISPILSTLPATPPDTVNMMVGHYFEDYYEYLSFIKQGQKGSLILENLFDSTDRANFTIPWWPYSLLGFLGNLFHLQIPAQLIYWFSSVAFCFIILLTTFTAVKTLLPGEKFSFQLLAFLLIIFSSGFFNIFDILKTPIQIIPYDFWYSIGPPFSRYNIGTPHHQAAQIILILALLFSITQQYRPYALATLGGHLMFSFLLLIISPPQLILFWLSYVTTVGLIIISNLKTQNSKLSVRQAQDPEYIEGLLKSQNYKDNTTKPKVSILETNLIESQNSENRVATLKETISETDRPAITSDTVKINYLAQKIGNLYKVGVSEKFVSEELHYNKEKSNTTKKISSASKIERQDSQVSIASKLLFPFVFTAIILAPLAYLIQRSSHSSPVYLSGKLWDISHLYYPGLSLFLLSSGPLLLIAIFGLPSYFSRVSFSRLLFFLITFFSFIFTLIPITIGQSNILSFLGFHNLRFSTPHSYIFLGIAAVLFLRAILKKPIGIYAVGILVFVYLSLSVSGFWQIHARNPYSAGFLQFLPSKLYQGLKTLENNNVDSAVLASPSSLLGVIIPAISGRRVYIGRSIFTQHLAKKTATATKFYALQMAPDEAKNFLGKEKIDSILLTQTDTGKKEFLEHYKFLRILYENNQLTILKLY